MSRIEKRRAIVCLSCFATLKVSSVYMYMYTVNRKRWQYICDHNFGKSRSISIIFALLEAQRNFFTHDEKRSPHLNVVFKVTLPCENETSHFTLL